MRCNQVSIGIERFGEYVPKNYPGNVQRISVYVDDFTSIYAALSKAYALAINALAEYDHIGARTDVFTNEYAGANDTKMHGTIPKERRSYREDVNFQYNDTNYELCKDYIWLYEHSAELIDVIKNSRNPGEMTIELKEKYGLSDYQIKKLSQIRLDMLTTEKYEECQRKIEEFDDIKEQIANGRMRNESGYKNYVRRQLRKYQERKSELEAYITAAENVAEIAKLMEENEDFIKLASVMQARFGFSLNQTRYLRYMPLYIFDRKVREEKKQELARVIDQIEFCERECKESEE